MWWWFAMLACGGSEPAVAPPPAESVVEEPPVSEVEDAPSEAEVDPATAGALPTGVPWLGFTEIPEGMKGCRLDQKFGNALFDNSVALRCGKGGRILAAAVSTERWEASANALSTQAEAALGEPEQEEQRLGWTVKQWTQSRSAITALLQRDGTTVYVGCVDGPAERTCRERVAQLITGLGKEPSADGGGPPAPE